MKLTSRPLVAICSLVPLTLMGFAGAVPSMPKAGAGAPKIPYSKISSLISTKCVSCHNATRHPEAVDLSSYTALMKSGEHGPIVIAGHPEKSKLIMYVDGEKQPQMPMKKAPLSKAEITLLKQWISAGAKG